MKIRRLASTMQRRSWTWFAVACVLFALWAVYYWSPMRGRYLLLSLLNNQPREPIAKLSIQGQRRLVWCDDSQTIGYLNHCISRARRESEIPAPPLPPGSRYMVYDLWITFSSGATARARLSPHVDKTAFDVEVIYGLFDADITIFTVDLQTPVPAPIVEMMRVLTTDDLHGDFEM